MLMNRGTPKENTPPVVPITQQRSEPPKQSPIQRTSNSVGLPAPINQFQNTSSSNLSKQQKANIMNVNPGITDISKGLAQYQQNRSIQQLEPLGYADKSK